MNTEGVHIPGRGHEDVERPDQGRAESSAAVPLSLWNTRETLALVNLLPKPQF